jgi:hypothetical protein
MLIQQGMSDSHPKKKYADADNDGARIIRYGPGADRLGDRHQNAGAKVGTCRHCRHFTIKITFAEF